MRSLLLPISLISLISLSFFTSSCENEERQKAKQKRLDEDNFFADLDRSTSLSSLENELADSHTNFARSFANDPIPWQKWDRSLLEKASSSQSPIMALVGSSLRGDSRQLGRILSANPKIRNFITEFFVCTLVDAHEFPEMALLSHHLSRERGILATLPTIIWLSHEGSPLSWIPLAQADINDLEVIIQSSTMMIQDTWESFSDYAITDSRNKHQKRQLQIDQLPDELDEQIDRNELFRRSTRHLNSLYSPSDRNFDDNSKLIPTSRIELLSIGSQSQQLTAEVRAQCLRAAQELGQTLMQEACKDHLEGTYFFARRAESWVLPIFSKTVSSQARIAHMFLHIGGVLEEPEFVNEGRSLLSKIESEWIATSISSRSPSQKLNEPQGFIWKLSDLETLLSEDELSLAVAAFLIKKDGNIPLEVDPTANSVGLNSLSRRVPLKTVAKQLNRPLTEVQNSLKLISKKLLKHREDGTQYEEESTFSLSDLALILKAKITLATLTRDPVDIQSACVSAEQILKNYKAPEKGLSRLPFHKHFTPARCIDYANCSNAFLLLYQTSLDEKWLTHGLELLDEGITKLKADNGLLSEISESEWVIPLRNYGFTMTLGESSLGVLDLSLNRAWAITGDEKYREILKTQHRALLPSTLKSPTLHTDYLASCALGNTPLLALVSGTSDSSMRKEFLKILNSPKHLPFLSIRAAKLGDGVNQGTTAKTKTEVTLTRDGKTLGRATSPSALKKLLSKIISGK